MDPKQIYILASTAIAKNANTQVPLCACGAPLPVGGHWTVMTDAWMALCPECLAHAPEAHELGAIADDLNARTSSATDPMHLGILRTSDFDIKNTLWNDVPIERRSPFEIGTCGMGYTAGLMLSVAGGEDTAPQMSTALHRLYRTTPAPRPHVPTEEELAAEAETRAEAAATAIKESAIQRRDAAVVRLAFVLGAGTADDKSIPAAREILDAISDYFGFRSPS